jgi:hypothetical protein
MSEKPLELKPGHPAERAVYATRDGRLVEEDDPEASELVVGAGGVVTEKMAKRYRGGGASPAEGTPVPSDAAETAPPEQHAHRAPEEADESGQARTHKAKGK